MNSKQAHQDFEDLRFQQALARARADEAAELAAIVAGNGPAPSRDIGEMLREQNRQRVARALSQWMGS